MGDFNVKIGKSNYNSDFRYVISKRRLGKNESDRPLPR